MIVFIWVLGCGYIEVVYYLFEVGVNFDVVDKVDCGVIFLGNVGVVYMKRGIF